MNYVPQLVLFALIFLSSTLSAQILKKDTLELWKKYDLIKYTEDPEQLEFSKIDTSASRHSYMNFLDLKAAERNVLGYAGQTVYDLSFTPFQEVGFDLGFHQLDLYRYRWDNVFYFDNDAPYTRLTFLIGPDEDQHFQVMHSQKIKQRFIVNLDFQRLSSQGNLGANNSQVSTLNRQGAGSKNLFAELWYRSLNGKYNAAFGIISNAHEVNEHGGVVDISDLTENFSNDRNLIQVNFEEAAREQSDRRLRFRQSLDFGKYYNFALNDSVTIKKLDPKLRLYHSIEKVEESVSYIDARLNTNNYLYEPAFNLASTNNLIASTRWNHRAGLNILLGKNEYATYTGEVKAGLEYQSIFLRQGSDYFYGDWNVGRYLDNTLLESEASVRRKDGEGFDFKGELDFGILGESEGDMYWRLNAGYEIKLGGLELWNEFSRRRPSNIYFRNISNHNPYDILSNFPSLSPIEFPNGLDKVSIGTFGAALNFKLYPIKVSVENSIINNWTYFNEMEVPFQSDEIFLLSAKVETGFVFGKWHFDSNFQYQETSSDILGVPRFLGVGAIHYRTPLFKNALVMNVGLKARFWSRYRNQKYVPHLGQFVYGADDENGEANELKTYPIIDAFVNFELNRVRLFLKTEHLSQGLGGNIYFPTPYISGPDRMFRAGFSWIFYN